MLIRIIKKTKMKEQLILGTTAFLAKEKNCLGLNQTNDYVPMYIINDDNNKIELSHGQGEDDTRWNFALAITQSLLQKWIRENHKIHITIFSSSQESWMYRITKPGQKLEDGLYGEDFYTYEEALEEALAESLKTIKI